MIGGDARFDKSPGGCIVHTYIYIQRDIERWKGAQQRETGNKVLRILAKKESATREKERPRRKSWEGYYSTWL